jgi:hypothetical protein
MGSTTSKLSILGGALLVVACSKKEPTPVVGSTEIERGEYLVTVGCCNDCHSPKVQTPNGPEPDPKRVLSGHPAEAKLSDTPAGLLGPEGWGAVANSHLTAWSGPWGVTFAANLTPDETGMLNWTPDTFIKTLRTGKHFGVGRPVLPPMPWFNYAKMTERDLKAMFAYLRSLPPISNSVPSPIPPASENQAVNTRAP